MEAYRSALLQAYTAHTEALPLPARRTCASVLYNCVLAVKQVMSAVEVKSGTVDSPHEVLVGDIRVVLPQTGSNATFTSLLSAERKASRAVADMGKDIILLQGNDTIMLESACCAITMQSQCEGEDDTAVNCSRMNELREFEYRALMRSQASQLLRGTKPEPLGFPIISDSSMNLSINEAELRTFCPLPAKDMYTFNQMQEADELIKSVSQPLPDFTKSSSASGTDSLVLGRKYYQSISASSLAQALRSEILKEPTVLQRYYPATDELIYLLHWPPPHRRVRLSDWAPADHLRNVHYLPNAETSFIQDSLTITPAGQAIVIAKSLSSTGAAWLSVHLGGALFGLRSQNDLYNFKASRTTAPRQRRNKALSVEPAPVEEPILEPVPIENPVADGDGETPEGDDLQGENEEKSDLDETEGTEVPVIAAKPVPEVIQTQPSFNDPVYFVFEDEDFSRIVIQEGPVPKKQKPDKCGTMIVTHTNFAGLSTSACSNGTLRIFSSITGLLHTENSLGEEKSRTIAPGGVVSRRLHNGPFQRDILYLSGDRILTRNNTPNASNNHETLKGFYHRLLKDAPADWTYVRLGCDGSVLFYCTNKSGKNRANVGIPHATYKDLRNISIDAETKSEVISYMDGRTIVRYTDGLLDVTFPDGTKSLTLKDSVAIISKPNLPTIEIDMEIDSMCIEHALGKQVSIAKGGLRVRSRIALSDGSALMVKYDTRITAECNGSIKLVKRDRTVIHVIDSGEVTVSPRASWDQAADVEFKEEAKDAYTPPAPTTANAESSATLTRIQSQSETSMLVHGGQNDRVNQSVTFDGANLSQATRGTQSTSVVLPGNVEPSICPFDSTQKTKYVFHVLKSSCLIEDYEYNRFQINLANVLEPIIDLAGEVEGLKPEAVTDKPLEPRLFIVQRTADAKEIVSDDRIIDLSRVAWYNADAERRTGEAPSTGPVNATIEPANNTKISSKTANPKRAISKDNASNDLFGNANAVNFELFSCRHRLGRYDDTYSFEEVFADRPWRKRLSPAVASIDMKLAQLRSTKNGAACRPPISANIFRVHSFTQCQPLPAAEYRKLSDDLKRWHAFREARVASIDRYAVGDSRSPEERAQEDALQERLSAVYKEIQKKKRKSAKMQMQMSIEEKAILPQENAIPVQDLPADDGEHAFTADGDDSSSVIKRKELESLAIAKAEREITDAFESFADERENGTLFLQYVNIPLALIQLFGIHIDAHLVDLALAELGFHSRSPRGGSHASSGYGSTTLSHTDFRNLLTQVRLLLKLREEEENRRRRETLPVPPNHQMSRHSSSDTNIRRAAGKRIQTGPARLQNADEDDQPVLQGVDTDQFDVDPSGMQGGGSFVDGLGFADGWSELDSASHIIGGLGEGSLERLSKTAPGKAQNASRSWYEDDEPITAGRISGVASMTEDLSKHSSNSYPQGSALQVIKAAKKS